jgi:CheY-like chemotaxis protein/HPt (histidine-containing phosphotransfer) domain-containing protein
VPSFAKQGDALDANKQKISASRLLVDELPLRILLAEDNAINRRVALAMLSRLGYRGDAVENGIEVLAALERGDYDVVLMDVQMPEMDGITATRRIRETVAKDKQPRIIAMTANVSTEDREQCLAAGMDDFVDKPMRIEDLAAALSRQGPQSLASVALEDAMTEHVLDVQTVHSLRDLGGLNAIVFEFLGEVSERIAAIRRATEEQDFASLELEAHTLKGASGVVGAALMAKTAAKLEKSARAHSTHGVMALLDQLEHDFKKTRSALDAEMAKP